ncbi:HPr(Ser) kinase/phosphatase [Mycoplasmopsis gallopavonis]|uniref:HPr kinase/phosphorylase n=1 Tax=Mycoplasmopsis gallopavonis TaxID=76629 RepID=A0A449AYK0_9BACT|nr:HPr(Ser) kinase/phosphatase [Mycoplasmopsis gallopavonis]RIV16528.1 HPr kinase/phosphorylase [Mycoplasmopsis gallopavonis]VEU72580.1 HPr kinase/phosphorylase [Mycoplasmopsis gallopavonis]
MSRRSHEKINVSKIIKFFDLNIINKDNPNLEYNYISEPAIKRVGLELSELIRSERLSLNVISWGTSESLWFAQIGKKRALHSLRHVFSQKPPIVILSKGVNKPALAWIVEVANEYNVPVALTSTSSSIISTVIGSYLNDHFAEEIQVHGSLVLIGATGVLITGASGVGKSEAALELIQKGHILIADDAVLIKDSGNLFIGRSPRLIQDLLEVRGIGLINVKETYGITKTGKSSIIDLVVELVQQDKQNELDRLGTEIIKYPIFGRYIRKIRVPIKQGGSAATLIEAAVNAYLSWKDGKNPIDDLYKRRKQEEEENDE